MDESNKKASQKWGAFLCLLFKPARYQLVGLRQKKAAIPCRCKMNYL
jgi:hypothetical protein